MLPLEPSIWWNVVAEVVRNALCLGYRNVIRNARNVLSVKQIRYLLGCINSR